MVTSDVSTADPAAKGAKSESARERDGLSHRVVFAVLGVSLAAAFALAVYVYQRYVRYEPHIADYMPADYAVALHLDVEQAVVYEPFRRHLLGLVEAHRPPEPAGGRKSVPRLEVLRDETTIELGVDLRELGIAVDRSGAWLLLLGGHFREDGVAGGVARLLRQEGVRAEVRAAPERLVHESGIAFAAAGDGVLVLAQTEAVLLRALGSRAAHDGAAHPTFEPKAALSLRLGAEGPALPEGAFSEGALTGGGLLDGAVLNVLPGQTFRAEFVFPAAPSDLNDEALVGLLSGKTGDFKLLALTRGWQFDRTSSGMRRAHTVLSREDFDRLVGDVAAGLARLMGLGPVGDAAPHPGSAVQGL